MMAIDINNVGPMKGLKCICHNVRSMNDETFTEWSKLLSHFDIGLVTESWLVPDIDSIESREIMGYHHVRLDRKPTVNKVGGGLLIYVMMTCFTI